ncbi:MAG TPA: DUF2889 domain-containing protein [Syntrophomonadaceae bacterium]|nr:DUF2889 domain-containing protein [Syntrophomonadaceae bacterium]
MSTVYHSTLTLKVNRISDDELLAETSFLSSDREVCAWMRTDVARLQIKDAGWAVYRSPQATVSFQHLPELVGMEAYLDSGPRLKNALGGKYPELARELLSECIRGIIQSETFFYTERGFIDPAQYDDFWDKLYVNSCHYYSHLDQIDKPWMEYAGGEGQRRGCLFTRCQSVSIHEESPAGFLVDAVFIDSFHELSVRMMVDNSSVVKRTAADYRRAPDKICWNNTRHLDKLEGQHLILLNKKDIANLAGGPEGCHHLVDLLYSVCQAAHTLWLQNQEAFI